MVCWTIVAFVQGASNQHYMVLMGRTYQVIKCLKSDYSSRCWCAFFCSASLRSREKVAGCVHSSRHILRGFNICTRIWRNILHKAGPATSSDGESFHDRDVCAGIWICISPYFLISIGVFAVLMKESPILNCLPFPCVCNCICTCLLSDPPSWNAGLCYIVEIV